MRKINVTCTDKVMNFSHKGTGSSLTIKREAVVGVRVYSYHNNDSYGPDHLWAIKIFLNAYGHDPLVYNGYTTEQLAKDDANEMIKLICGVK